MFQRYLHTLYLSADYFESVLQIHSVFCVLGTVGHKHFINTSSFNPYNHMKFIICLQLRKLRHRKISLSSTDFAVSVKWRIQDLELNLPGSELTLLTTLVVSNACINFEERCRFLLLREMQILLLRNCFLHLPLGSETSFFLLIKHHIKEKPVFISEISCSGVQPSTVSNCTTLPWVEEEMKLGCREPVTCTRSRPIPDSGWYNFPLFKGQIEVRAKWSVE